MLTMIALDAAISFLINQLSSLTYDGAKSFLNSDDRHQELSEDLKVALSGKSNIAECIQIIATQAIKNFQTLNGDELALLNLLQDIEFCNNIVDWLVKAENTTEKNEAHQVMLASLNAVLSDADKSEQFLNILEYLFSNDTRLSEWRSSSQHGIIINEQKKISADVKSLIPSVQKDKGKLLQYSKKCIDRIIDKVAHKLIIPCLEEVEAIEASVRSSDLMQVILGTSGSGKSVLAKRISEKFSHVIWVSADLLNSGLEVFCQRLQLEVPFHDCLASMRDTDLLLCVDSLESLTDFRGLQDLLQECKNTFGLNFSTICTCQSEHWIRVEDKLMTDVQHIIEWQTIQKGEWGDSELSIVIKEFPSLRRVFTNDRIKSVLGLKPQIIHLLCLKSNRVSASSDFRWLSEIDPILWIWDRFVGNDTDPVNMPKAVFLQTLARDLADTEKKSLPRSHYSSSDLAHIGQLNDVISIVDGKISFVHDLFGDWARFKFLIENRDDLSVISMRSSQPFWQNAIRLFGCYLIEKGETVSDWINLFTNTPEVRSELFESIFLSTRSYDNLEAVKTLLFEDDGKYLKSFLQRFLYSATEPNTGFIKYLKEQGMDFKGSSNVYRLPKLTDWFGVLKFILSNLEHVAKLALNEYVKIVQLWRKSVPADYHFRAELADHIVKVAYELLDSDPIRGHVDSKTIQLVFEEALNTVDTIPDKALSFAKHASKLVAPTDATSADRWPNGPYSQVRRDFEEVVLNTNAIEKLISLYPIDAKAIVLAVVIRHIPKEEDYRFQSHGRRNEGCLEVKDPFYLHPNIWYRGPFYKFLNLNFDTGLDLIIDLVNFASKRWAELSLYGESEPVNIFIDGKVRKLNGGYRCFYWFRGIIYNPPLISSALMALEKWFYDKLEKKDEVSEEVTKAITIIKDKMESVAFAGLLFEVGRFKLSLFFDELKELFSIPELESWEYQYGGGLSGMQGMGVSPIGGSTEVDFNEIQKWNIGEHRKITLFGEPLALIYVRSKVFQEYVDDCRPMWNLYIAEHTCSDDAKLLKRLSHLLDMANWKDEPQPDGTMQVRYNPPEQTEEEKEAAENALLNIQYVGFPTTCRSICNDECRLADNAQIENIWNIMLGFIDFESSNKALISRDTIVQGGLAVFFRFHYEWLLEHPDKLDWAMTELSQFAEKVFHNWGAFPEFDNSDFDENTFWVQSVFVLFKKEPTNIEFRKWAGYAICNWKYVTVDKFISLCYRHRVDLGENFYQLVHFTLYWSMIRCKIKRGNSYYQDGLSLEEAATIISHEMELFVSGDYPTDLKVDLKTLEQLKESQQVNNEDFIDHRTIGFDFCNAVFGKLFNLEDAINSSENTKFSEFWEFLFLELIELVDLEVARFKEDLATDSSQVSYFSSKEDSIQIYEDDRWLLKRIAQNAKYSKNFALCEIVVDYGAVCIDWIEELFRYIIESALDNETEVKILTHFLNYFEQVKSSFSSEHKYWDVRKVLLGFTDFFPELHWPKITEGVVRQLIDEYRDFIDFSFKNGFQIDNIIHWLCKCDGSVILREECLDKMAHYYRNDNDRFFYYINRDALSYLLEHIWNIAEADLRKSSKYKGNFNILLQALCDRNNVKALELRNRIVAK